MKGDVHLLTNRLSFAQGISHYTIYNWALADLLIASSESGICRIVFSTEKQFEKLLGLLESGAADEARRDDQYFAKLRRQLDRYFSGGPVEFDMQLDLTGGTDFQRLVWNEVRRVKYGQTKTYSQIAVGIGRPKAVRAVGSANGSNPVPLFVPCHRIVGSDGGLGGYGPGLEIKDSLLRLEGAIL